MVLPFVVPASSLRRAALALATAAVWALSACGSDGGSPAGPDDNGGLGGSGGGGGSGVLADPSFGTVIQPIFEQRGCTVSSCHGTPYQADLRLLADSAWVFLVNYEAVMEPQEIRVIPGDAADSYLVKKVEGLHAIGNRMPPTGDTLSLEEQQNLRNWIDQGAKQN